MEKIILHGDDARSKILTGVNVLAKAVACTLGPKGRNVLIEENFKSPHLTKDGVTVAKSIALSDPTENLGAQIVKQAAGKTVQEAGDGTTTATVLAHAMVTEAQKHIAAGVSPIQLKEEMEEETRKIVENLRTLSEEVKEDWDKIEQVATISANGDKELGSLIREAYEHVGVDGVVGTQDSKSSDTYIEKVKGYRWDRGYISPLFINNDKLTVELENVYILLYDKKIRSPQEIIPLLEQVLQKDSNASFLIVAEDVESMALGFLATNKLRANLKVAAVKAPFFGQRRFDVLEDIAVLTGGTLISESNSLPIQKAELSHLGRAGKVVVTKNDTTIMEAKGSTKALKERVKYINTQFEQSSTDWDREKNKARAAHLKNGVAVIYIGGQTDVELNERKDRLDDALHSTNAALAEGILPGGGTALLTYSLAPTSPNLGSSVVRVACASPFNTIISNAGGSPDSIRAQIAPDLGEGYNARTGEISTNMKKDGIIDPTRVVVSALKNATSVATALLMTETTIVEKDKQEMSNPNVNL